MRWAPFVMVRIAAVFIAGVLISIYDPEILIASSVIVLLFSLITAYFIVYYFLRGTEFLKIISGIIGLAAIFSAGYLNVTLRNESRSSNHLIQNKKEILAYQVRLIGYAEEKKNSIRRTVSVEAIMTDDGWKNVFGKVNLYWPKSEPVRDLDFGDRILIQGSPEEVRAPLNPGEFDYRRFLGFKNIFQQQYVKSSAWHFIYPSDDHGFWFYALRARRWSVNTIKQFVKSPQQQAIAVALVLGVTDGIDNELLNAYAASGAMHVLAVSGMHVSIIYAVLLFIFRPLKKIPKGDWIIAACSLLLLWSYAFVTGLSPSVLRAVAMFSFVAVAGPFARRTNVYNTLAASAFCLLLYDPFLMMSAGFQLSYVAVWGIVYLYRPIYNLWEAKSLWINWIWQITCVSIAAQIATLPLVLYYFHQFPLYALCANLFVIPGSSVILLGGVLLLIVSPFIFLAGWVGLALEWCIQTFNDGLFLIEKLPMSLIENMYLAPMQAILFSFIMLSVILLIQFKEFKYVAVLSVCSVCFSTLAWARLYNDIIPPSMTIYSVRGHSAVDWVERGKGQFQTDSIMAEDEANIKFHIQPWRLMSGVSQVEFQDGTGFRNVGGLKFRRWHRKTFLWINSKSPRLPIWARADYLIIGNNSINSLQETLKCINFSHVIFDGTNSYRYCERLEKEARRLQIDYSFVLKDGSYTVNL